MDRSEPATIAGALRAAAARLAATSPTPRLDAELLMARALGTTREALLLGAARDPAPAGYAGLVERRAAGEPVAYITGTRGFWTIELAVGPGVLIPRPDSETLIEAAVGHFAGTQGPATVLDLGTGSGALLLAALAEWPGATGLGIDLSEAALAVARGNAGRLGMAARARFRLGDWAEGIAARFDLVLCNPPYVETGAALAPELGHEPAEALFAGADGLDAYRRLAPVIGRLIAPGGVAVLELGAGQAGAVRALLAAEGSGARAVADLGGHARCLVVTPAEAGA